MHKILGYSRLHYISLEQHIHNRNVYLYTIHLKGGRICDVDSLVYRYFDKSKITTFTAIVYNVYITSIKED